MSNLKKDIEKILKDFVLWRTKIIDGKPVATYDKNMLSEWEREQYQPMEAVTQIINLIESVIPEEIDVKSKYETDDDGGIIVVVDENNDTMTGENLVHLARLASDEGYNQAIKDIKNKLIGKE